MFTNHHEGQLYYNKNMAPFTVESSNDRISAVEVNISATVMNILKINEVEQSLKLKISLLLTWYENRVVYHNLKKVGWQIAQP